MAKKWQNLYLEPVLFDTFMEPREGLARLTPVLQLKCVSCGMFLAKWQHRFRNMYYSV